MPDLFYSYDDSGNVLTMGFASFTYDKLDRLETASGAFGFLAYAYDALGNRLREDRDPSTESLAPVANGDAIGWSQYPASGFNYDKVVSGDGDTTYVYASSGTPLDLYAVADPTASGLTVDSVTVYAEARYEATSGGGGGGGGGGCKPNACPTAVGAEGAGTSGSGSGSLHLAVKTDGQVRTSPAHYLASAYGVVSWTLSTNPVTGEPWTEQEVKDLQAGVQLALTTTSVRVTRVWVDVNVVDRTVSGYDPAGMNELWTLTGNGGAVSFAYDANGNLRSRSPASPTNGAVRCHDWTPPGLLAAVRDVAANCDTEPGTQVQRYVYDALGRRVKVEGSDPNTWTVSIYAGEDVIFEARSDGGWTKYVLANGMRIARADFDPLVGWPVYYYVTDALGSTRQARDESRNLVFSAEYEPFGKPYNVWPDPSKESFLYTGEKHDPTGLVYLRARMYDPDLGRFLSPDPVLGALSAPQTLNRYAYVVNDPLRYTDPTGKID